MNYPLKIVFLVVCSGLIVASCSSSSKGPNMTPGKWEISTRIEMKNMPFPIPPMSFTQCLTQDDLIPQDSKGPGEQPCKITASTTKGDTVSWTVVCDTPQGQSTSSGAITYRGENFEGEIIVEAGAGMEKMIQKMTGKRIGPCE